MCVGYYRALVDTQSVRRHIMVHTLMDYYEAIHSLHWYGFVATHIITDEI